MKSFSCKSVLGESKNDQEAGLAKAKRFWQPLWDFIYLLRMKGGSQAFPISSACLSAHSSKVKKANIII